MALPARAPWDDAALSRGPSGAGSPPRSARALGAGLSTAHYYSRYEFEVSQRVPKVIMSRRQRDAVSPGCRGGPSAAPAFPRKSPLLQGPGWRPSAVPARPSSPAQPQRRARGRFTSGGARGHLGSPSLGQAEHPVCARAVARLTLAPVATRGVDTVLGTAAPSDTALVHVCGKGGVCQAGGGTHTEGPRGRPVRGPPRPRGGPRPLGEGGPRLTCLADISPPPCGALAAAWLDTAPSVLAWWLADCCG